MAWISYRTFLVLNILSRSLITGWLAVEDEDHKEIQEQFGFYQQLPEARPRSHYFGSDEIDYAQLLRKASEEEPDSFLRYMNTFHYPLQSSKLIGSEEVASRMGSSRVTVMRPEPLAVDNQILSKLLAEVRQPVARAANEGGTTPKETTGAVSGESNQNTHTASSNVTPHGTEVIHAQSVSGESGITGTGGSATTQAANAATPNAPGTPTTPGTGSVITAGGGTAASGTAGTPPGSGGSAATTEGQSETTAKGSGSTKSAESSAQPGTPTASNSGTTSSGAATGNQQGVTTHPQSVSNGASSAEGPVGTAVTPTPSSSSQQGSTPSSSNSQTTNGEGNGTPTVPSGQGGTTPTSNQGGTQTMSSVQGGTTPTSNQGAGTQTMSPVQGGTTPSAVTATQLVSSVVSINAGTATPSKDQGGSSSALASLSTPIRQFSPTSPNDASANLIIVTLPSVNDADHLENWPTNMDLVDSILATQLLGYVAGYLQVDKCAYELLETCKPVNGSKTCSVDDCTALCNSMPNCGRITFRPDGLCQMETRSCQRQSPVSSSNSFVKVSNVYIQFPGNCPDNFIYDESLKDDARVGCTRCTIEECRFECDMLPRCVGFSYANPPPTEDTNRQCYIKQNVCTTPIHGTHIFYQKLPLYV